MDIDSILQSIPGGESLDEGVKQSAREGALMPDSAGVYPGEEGYSRTEDPWFAVLSLLPLLQALPQVTSASSEGASIKTEPPDWGAMERYLRSHSPIMQGMTSVFGVIEIPSSRYQRLVLSKENHDIDTDVG